MLLLLGLGQNGAHGFSMVPAGLLMKYLLLWLSGLGLAWAVLHRPCASCKQFQQVTYWSFAGLASVAPAAASGTTALQNAWVRRHSVGNVCTGLLEEGTHRGGTEVSRTRKGRSVKAEGGWGIFLASLIVNSNTVWVPSSSHVFMLGGRGGKWCLPATFFFWRGLPVISTPLRYALE